MPVLAQICANIQTRGFPFSLRQRVIFQKNPQNARKFRVCEHTTFILYTNPKGIAIAAGEIFTVQPASNSPSNLCTLHNPVLRKPLHGFARTLSGIFYAPARCGTCPGTCPGTFFLGRTSEGLEVHRNRCGIYPGTCPGACFSFVYPVF